MTKRLFSPRIAARQLCAQVRMQPNFIVVGAQKAGTSSLFNYICQHSAVAAPMRKEIHYFDLNADRPYSWYKAHFPLRSQGKITGEASPYYLFHPLAPERIAARLPNVKIIIMLRHPIDRAISHYWHAQRHGYENLSPHEAFATEKERLAPAIAAAERGEYALAHQHYSYAARSCYSAQVAAYLKRFPAANVKLLTMEDLMCDPASLVADTVSFLGLPPATIPDLAPRNVNPNRQMLEIPDDVRAELIADAAELDTLTGQSFSASWFGEPPTGAPKDA
jgi:hypothetical protein